MSRSSRKDNDIREFVKITGATSREAKRYLDKHQRLDIAIDSYLTSRENLPPAPSSSQLEKVFNHYKGVYVSLPSLHIHWLRLKKKKKLFNLDRDDDDITVDGTLNLCNDLAVDPEDVVLLAVAYELQSPAVGRWKKSGWVQGWKGLGVDSLEGMKGALPRLRKKLGSDPDYFRRVYLYTFDFARSEGQRSLGIEIALDFWSLLLPHGLKGGALRPQDHSGEDDDSSILMKADGDDNGSGEGRWSEEHTQLWYDFLNERNIKGISKDTWAMFLAFLRTIDAKFETYDMEAAWPSTLDDFVEWTRERLRES
ncbi:defective in Cullin neddylation protein 1 [Multifurca ochricompacta]|uniref:Defective in cullin neddylation protein n=1 Tax=Multifurca ochricompacta TaxID=376703 RepID=A0AAD4M2H1_9AGAM|nr:defective in Cullin neddylation protein 1 [Multifurca ochricompacta]